MKELSPEQIEVLKTYKPIYDSFPYGERAPEFTAKDEKIIEGIYNFWRGSNHKIAGCDECLEEAFSRLIVQMEEQSKQAVA